MKVGLPFAAYVLILVGLRTRGRGWRAAGIGAAVVWGVLVVLITELLSLLGGLTQMNLAIAWLVVDVAALIYPWSVVLPTVRQDRIAALCMPYRPMASRLPKDSVALLSGVGVLLTLVALVALLSPPNTWDVLVYHMPRIVHWIQNQSLAFYSTPEPRQLYLSPGAEYAILQLHVLFGSDRLNNVVQLSGFLGSVVGVTLLAQCLGAGYRGQVLAAVISATIPQGILQASGAKNDYVVAFWLVALAYYLCRFQRERTSTNALAIGGALGLAWLTKGTAYVFSLPMMALWALTLPRGVKTTLFKRLPFVVILALALNAGHSVRNYRLFGSPLGPNAGHPSGAFRLTNEELTVAGLMSNILRNLALHLGTPITAVNTRVEQWIESLIRAFGDDANNPHTTWTGTAFHVPMMSRHEALAGNPLHLTLIMLVSGLMIGWLHLRTTREIATFAVGLILAFLFFCALFRWQPWHTRLHLPLFVLFSAVIATVLAQVWPPSVTTSLGILLLLLSVPFALGNQLRPLAFGGELNILRQERRMLYFAENPELLHAFRPAAEFVKEQGCESIGLDLPGDSPAYALYVLLDAGGAKKRIQYVDVRNPSARYAQDGSGPRPCAVVCLDCTKTHEKWKAYSAWIGPPTIFRYIVVFGAKGSSPPMISSP